MWCSVLFVLVLHLLLAKGAKESYGVVVDLGSKGSRVGVFVWPSDAKTPYTEVKFGGGKTPWYSKINPGVATFANNPQGAGPYLRPLLEYASATVPAAQHATTPIFIRGTDNLRQIPPLASKAILASLYDYTQVNYNFLMTEACIDLLDGIQEAGFLWVAVNYLRETFANKVTPMATLDLGSGSTQITFIPKSGTYLPPNYTYQFDYHKQMYPTYTHSYSGYGYLSALYNINSSLVQATPSGDVINPCLLHGYSVTEKIGNEMVTMRGAGSWMQCSALTVSLLDLNAPCALPPCPFDGAFQPALNGNFLAVSNYADVVEVLGLGDRATPQQITTEGIKFCALSWSQALQKYPETTASELYTFCFGANYISNLLFKGYGFPLNTEINFGKKYNKVPYSWTLGAMVHELQKGW